MEFFTGGSVNSFISATALVWAAFIILIMIGVVYFIKKRNEKKENYMQMFFYLYIVTFLLNIMEFVIYYAMSSNDSFIRTFLCKFYVFLGFLWSILIISFIVSYLFNASKYKFLFYGFIVLLSFVAIICCIVFRLDIVLENYGKFYELDGPLITIYNRFAVFSNLILLIILLKNNRKISQTFGILCVFLFSIYIVNYLVESRFGYSVKESIFIYSLIVLSIFNTIANQDKHLLTNLNNKKILFESLDHDRNLTIFKLTYNIRNSLNNIVSNSDSMVLSNNNIDSSELNLCSNSIYNSGIVLSNHVENVLCYSRLQGNEETTNINNFKLESLINDVYNFALPIANIYNKKFIIYCDNNFPESFVCDYSKIKKIVCNLVFDSISNSNLNDINLYLKFNTIDSVFGEFEFTINNSFDNKLDILNTDATKFIYASNELNSGLFGVIIANNFVNLLNGSLTIENNNYVFKIKLKYL